jgi:glycosyltransferase involved in cell wall biosynthesis
MTKGDSSGRPVWIIVPFEKQPDPTGSCLSSLQACEDELKDLRCTVIVIHNDADSRSMPKELLGDVPCVQHRESVGSVRKANLGLKQAVDRGADVVLLSPNIIVFPGALREMQRIAYLDSMIGFVSARSNDAGIGSFPHQQGFRKAEPASAHAIFTELFNHLPEFQYVPAASESCLFIKLEVLTEFGLFDETYEDGHDAGNDLVMRANRCGYRAVLADHAFVYHTCLGSPSVSEERGGSLVASRYPEYTEHLNAYFESAHYQAEVLLAGLLKDDRGRYGIVFDFSHFGIYHNGTFEAAKQILTHAAAGWESVFKIYVLIDDEAARYHGLHRIPGIVLVPLKTTRIFAIAFRFGQPFDYDAIIRMSRLAVCNVYSMLDPIAWDCLYLNRQDLDEAWRAVFSYADATVYLSNFAARQFQLRFHRRAGLKELVVYPSLDPCDYRKAADDLLPSRGDYLLVIGNAFAHKNVRPTVEILSREFPAERIVALGLEETTLPNVIGHKSGHLSDEVVHDLFLKARAVIFPSFYEGFGFPIIRSLSYRKPILARSSAVNQDLSERLGRPGDLILYEDTEELICLLKAGLPAWKGTAASPKSEHNWATSAQEIGEFLRRLVDEVSYTDVLIPRLHHMHFLSRIAQSVIQRDSQMHRLENEASDLRIRVRQQELRIRSLLSSLSWAVTAPMRGLGNLWIRVFGNKSRRKSA